VNKPVKEKSREHGTYDPAPPFPVTLLILLQLLLAVGALAGGGALVLGPDGHLIEMPFSQLKYSPFSGFLIPGALLFAFLGLYPLAVGYGLWKRPNRRWANVLNPFKRTHWEWVASLVAGVILIIWITVQVILIRQVAALHLIYLAGALC
jgi:hypothetical protein